MLIIDCSVAEAILQHARGSFPAECCGLLLGERTCSGKLLVHSARLSANTERYQPGQAYTLDPHVLLPALLRAVPGSELLGFYHSHPAGSPDASLRDRRMAWPGFVYLICWLNHGGDWTLGAWQAGLANRRLIRCPISQESQQV